MMNSMDSSSLIEALENEMVADLRISVNDPDADEVPGSRMHVTCSSIRNPFD